jgi:hypothetical protein
MLVIDWCISPPLTSLLQICNTLSLIRRIEKVTVHLALNIPPDEMITINVADLLANFYCREVSSSVSKWAFGKCWQKV